MTVLTMSTEKKSITLFNAVGKLNVHIRNVEKHDLDGTLELTSEEADKLISWLQIFNNNLKMESK